MVVALDARLQGPGAAPAVVEADELAALQRELAVDAEQAVIACLRWARRWAFAPTSRFEVGAAAWGESGRVHLGANIEFSSLPLNETVHAEQSAIMQAWVHGERQLRALATSAAPCGYCRQFMLELPSPRPPILITGEQAQSLDALLPFAFGPQQLGREPGLLVAGPHGLVLDTPSADSLLALALAAADRSSAPYSGALAGVALRLDDGRCFFGGVAESAAYTPSLGPMQAALIALHHGGGRFSQIEAAALVEAESGPRPHRSAASRLLAAVTSPTIDLDWALASTEA